MERKLARIEKIENILPIEGKDFIEVATVLGWSIIVKKGDFQIGDLCIYIEPDSILPEIEEFEFLRSRCWNEKWKGFRIKTMKMAGIISQGIVFPIDLFPGITREVGSDITKQLNIIKYDPESLKELSNVKPTYKKVKNPIFRFLLKFKWIRDIFFPSYKKIPFPSHLVSKTDEQRIQNIPWILEKFKGTSCIVTEKLDGCSATYIYEKGKFKICSRNVIVENKDSYYHQIAKKYKLKEKLQGTDYAIQGEIIGHSQNGSGINLYNREELEFYVFNIVDTKTRKLLPIWDMVRLCQEWNLNTVPILDYNYILGENHTTVLELLNFSNGQSKLYDVLREGVVIRESSNKYQPIANVGDRLSFKVISPKFEIKYLNKESD